ACEEGGAIDVGGGLGVGLPGRTGDGKGHDGDDESVHGLSWAGLDWAPAPSIGANDPEDEVVEGSVETGGVEGGARADAGDAHAGARRLRVAERDDPAALPGAVDDADVGVAAGVEALGDLAGEGTAGGVHRRRTGASLGRRRIRR